MGMFIVVMVMTAMLVIGLVLSIAKPKLAKGITAVFLTMAAVGGVAVYGYGYLMVCDNVILAVLQAVPAVVEMFVGGNQFSDISSAPLLQGGWAQTLFWLIHCYAVYTTISAVAVSVGTTLLRKVRLRLLHWSRLCLICGADENTVALGGELQSGGYGIPVFVDNREDPVLKGRIGECGGILRTDRQALGAGAGFLKSLGCHKKDRQITLYALGGNASENMAYAEALLSSLRQLGVAPEQTRLVIAAQEDLAVERMQVAAGRYGYGYVTAFQAPQLAARLLTRECPPCRCISFDEEGKATEDFEALIIGFGQMGQAVLRQLVMSGQFEGSTFHANVFAPDCQSVDGRIGSQFGGIFDAYSITLSPYDGRSRELYRYVQSRGQKLKYVAICTGNEKRNYELAEDLTAYFRRLRICVPVYLCSDSGVGICDENGIVHRHLSVYQPELLSNYSLDTMAMLLNHRYQQPTDKTPLQAWMECDYFSRQSCRAAADFVPAMLHMVGKTRRQVLEEGWLDTPAQLENLSKTEHLRWCAFHYCMGFRAMDDQTFHSRTLAYEQDASVRIGKDMHNYLHACLVDWDALDALSEKEAAITGKNVDYKEMDRDNVLAIPQLLKQ